MNINDYGLGILVEEKSSREKFDNIQTEIIEEVESEINNELLLPPLPEAEDVSVLSPNTHNNSSVSTTASTLHEALASITSNSVSAIAAISSNQGNNTAGNNNSNNNNSNNSNSTTISNINLPGSRSQSVSGFNSPYFEQKSFEANYFDDSRRGSDYSEILLNSCLSSYEYTTNAAGAGQATGGGVGGFDSSTGFQIFPSMSTPAKDELNNNTNNNKETSSVQSTLPLKRLKSLKNGIRKLSLTSKSAPTTNLSTPVPLSRPILSPIQTTSSSNQQIPVQHQHSNNSTSADNSSTNSSDFSNLMNPIILSKRSRAFSGSAISTPTTPPLQSPVITLSENLTNSRKSLLCIEHSYFDSLNQAKGVSTTKSSSLSRSENDTDNDNDHDIENEDNDISPVYSVSELSKPSELIDYFMFLKEQKKSVIDAFEATRKKLKESGWCSEHDLNNLQLQQDSLLCQLDTKLSQIKERLDSEFNMSLFNEESYTPQLKIPASIGGTSAAATRNSSVSGVELSPSLRVLENRCFSFAAK